ncbi:hypothetical protein NSPZN2_100356 [Nitrospira defluvii]|uniref:Uncharacterized protein n=1 Tax=Nitrospira defluvii TaxID=330214 RepID=A0ABM8R3M6_9BACT|nr:hypothetical protein NSPZN2_100356 [Nitrospira defluvii]
MRTLMEEATYLAMVMAGVGVLEMSVTVIW